MWPVEKKTECKGSDKINDMKGPGTVSKHVAQKWFRHFKEEDTSLEDNSRSGKPSVVEDGSRAWNGWQAQALVHC